MEPTLPTTLNVDEDGYAVVPAGLLATIETSLERSTAPKPEVFPMPDGFQLVEPDPIDLTTFKTLYHAIGDPWLWSGRISRSDAEMLAILTEANRTLRYLQNPQGENIGFFETFRETPDTLEVTYFGLVPEATGLGLGAVMMEHGVAAAWTPDITRTWLHTCTFDSPYALSFYRKQGFKVFVQKVELGPDPRLVGDLPRSAAPHIPLADFSDP